VVKDAFPNIAVSLTQIPPESNIHGTGASDHLERFSDINAELKHTPPGTTCFVAAGLLGKLYCHTLKGAGCTAIDIGSVADAWIGEDTRQFGAGISKYTLTA
jgi:hypothetical protein